MHNNPLISVIVPCYNLGAYLPEALDAVISQTYPHWECIIVNDGSTDNTEEIAQSYLFKDKRFNYLKQNNTGLASARNAGIVTSNGNYILPLDADDKISSNYLEECMLTILSANDIKIVYGNGMKFGYVNEKWNLPEYDQETMLFKNIIHCSGLYNKNDWTRVGGYDVNMKNAFEDWEFWISILKDSGRAVRNEKATFFYRIRTESMISNLGVLDKEHLYQYVYTKHASLYNQYFINPIRLYKEREILLLELKKLQRKTLYSYYIRLKNKFKNKTFFL